jgi:hypothetical protein
MPENPKSVNVERIWLQGEEALVPILPLENDRVCYTVPGMQPTFELCDYRHVGRAALEAARTESGAATFHLNFDSSALLKVQQANGKTVLELHAPLDTASPMYDVLWIAAKVDDPRPEWPVAWYMESTEEEGHRSFVAILE